MVVITEVAERCAKCQLKAPEVLLAYIDARLAMMPGECVVDAIVKHGNSFLVLYTFDYCIGAEPEKRCASFRPKDGSYDMQFNMIVE